MSVTMSDPPRSGDRVRVRLTGEVVGADSTGFFVAGDPDSAHGHASTRITYASPQLTAIEITRRNYGVGDIIRRDNLATWAPNSGTIMREADRPGEMARPVRWMKTDQDARWVNEFGTFMRLSGMPGGDYVIEVVT